MDSQNFGFQIQSPIVWGDADRFVERLLDLLSYRFIANTSFCRDGNIVSYFDLLILCCMARKFQWKKAVEIGCGLTTGALLTNDVRVVSFALDQITAINHPAHTYNQKNIMDEGVAPWILQECKDADLLLIDGWHSYNFATFYIREILNHLDTPFLFLHDFYDKGKPSFTGEEKAVREQFMTRPSHSSSHSSHYDLFFATDCLSSSPTDELATISSAFGRDIGPYICRVHPPHFVQNCSAVFKLNQTGSQT